MFLEIDEIVSEKLMNGVSLSAMDKVTLARDVRRPKIQDYIDNLFTDFFEQKGDMLGKEDGSIYGGIALFHGKPVTVLGHRKGNDLKENLACNFGMPGPEGYRKALRLMQQAEHFNRPIICFVNTPGAYPGMEAEERGMGESIARNLMEMSKLKVPVLCILVGEGGSGGALATAVGNEVWMLENATYSILSPEGFASILWKDSTKKEQASEYMRLTAQDLLELGVIDRIVKEPKGGAHRNPGKLYDVLDLMLTRELISYEGKSGNELQKHRYKKFRLMDEKFQTLGRNR